MRLSIRRYYAWIALAATALFAFWLDYALRVQLRRAELVTGISLFAVVLLLTLFNARKKLPFLPLLSASTWMQIHIYVGLFSCILFGLHTGWRTPHGMFELTLAVLFWLVSGSGVVGLAISRWMPTRLTVHGENVVYERIPALQAGLRREVEELVLESVTKSQSTTIADFYELKLRKYFMKSNGFWYHVAGYGKPLFKLQSEVRALDRYLNAQEKEIMGSINDRILAKDNLDFQRACQGLLKGWLFVHIPLTYSMIIVATIHGFMAWKIS